MASFDLWTPEFCLGCDKQTDGAAYCSEACKLADFEKTSSASTPTSSSPSSPSLITIPSYPWATQSPSSGNKFCLSPAYDFHTHSPVHRNTFSSRIDLSASQHSSLTPSSSSSSLCSMQTAASRTEPIQLSERAQKELREYAISFEYARLQRRRSY